MRLDPKLRVLAHACGVQTSYRTLGGGIGRASPEALRGVLHALGVEAISPRDVFRSLRERRLAPWRRLMEPVVVAWGGVVRLRLRTPASVGDGRVAWSVTLEKGEIRSGMLPLGVSPVSSSHVIEGTRYVERQIRLPAAFPMGWHRLEVELGRLRGEASLLCAPPSGGPAEAAPDARGWGVFLPLYALRTSGDWGAGDYTGLGRLIDWVAGRGGEAVATLPLFPTFLDVPLPSATSAALGPPRFDPSPYAPVSRLFWNELYLDLSRAPELARSPRARAILASPEARRALARLRKSPEVDYRALGALKGRVLSELARTFFAAPRTSAERERRAAFEALLARRPELDDYARFRGACVKLGVPWGRWPAAARRGALRGGEVDEGTRRTHLYAQWLAEEQMARVTEAGRRRGAGLAVDLPLGVHPDGYDAWRHRSAFAPAVSVGAPPDPFFIAGQNWGFPPLHPERMREDGHRYFHSLLGHALRHARFLRIDHVMGLHRLFWIPTGFDATQGVYVKYPAEELYAILALESRRHGARILGENLGTVPAYVNRALKRHGVRPLYVGQVEFSQDPRRPLRPVPPGSIASLNTHDMPTFAGFWKGRDLADHVGLGLLPAAEAQAERRKRAAQRRLLERFLTRERFLRKGKPDVGALRDAWLEFLAGSPARLVLVNLEDLWLEESPQNVPGTNHDAGNWRRKARYALESFDRAPGAALAALARIRAHKKEESI